MRTPALLAAALLALLAFALTAASVSAHARRESSTPDAGEVLQASPARVEIVFTQDIQKVSGTYGITVTDEAGTDVTAGPAEIDDADRTRMSVDLQPALPNGRYVVMYRNVSDADGDPFEAGFAFYVGVQPTPEQLEQDALLEPVEASATQTFEAGGPTPPPGTPAGTPVGSATAVAPDGEDDDDGGNNTALIVLVVVAAAGIGIGLGYGAYRFLQGTR